MGARLSIASEASEGSRWLRTVATVLAIVPRATSRSISVSAACRDLAKAPFDQAVMTTMYDGLPKTLAVLERRWIGVFSVAVMEFLRQDNLP